MEIIKSIFVSHSYRHISDVGIWLMGCGVLWLDAVDVVAELPQMPEADLRRYNDHTAVQVRSSE